MAFLDGKRYLIHDRNPLFTALRTATSQFVVHYFKQRNHQGLGNRIINPEPSCGRTTGGIERRQRLGGLLNYYYRAAANVRPPRWDVITSWRRVSNCGRLD